jgi:hypothetical protein
MKNKSLERHRRLISIIDSISKELKLIQKYDSKVNDNDIIILKKSTNPDKKLVAIIGNKSVHFGAKKYSDYTLHKDKERMFRYENRHRKRENWTKSGLKTAGFWSKWILWNKPSLLGSIKDTEKRFNIKIKYIK